MSSATLQREIAFGGSYGSEGHDEGQQAKPGTDHLSAVHEVVRERPILVA